jgi:coenzyme F420-reducing hydrogenase delta subunit
MCSGRVDPAFVLRAFSNGTDGVFIGGCHINDCHYNTEGNYDAFSMVKIFKKVLEHIGVNPERLRLEWVSAGEGIRFAEIMNEYGQKIRELGPLGQDRDISASAWNSRFEAVSKLIPYIKLVERERLRIPERTEEGCQRFFDSEEFHRLFKELIEDKLSVNEIMALLEEQPLSTARIAEVLGMASSEVSKHMNTCSTHGWVRYDAGQKGYTLA